MKNLIIVVAALVCSSAFAKDVWVNPYVTQSGTIIPGHYKSVPDSSAAGSGNIKGGINPATGKFEAELPQPSDQPATQKRGIYPYVK